jgi:hypothetical protein
MALGAVAVTGAQTTAGEAVDGLWTTIEGEASLGENEARAVTALLVAQDGAVWVGDAYGAARYDGTWQPLEPSTTGLPAGGVRAIVQTPDGAIWFATPGGVARRSPDGQCCRVWREVDGMPSDNVYGLAESAPGEQGVWAATSEGLAHVAETSVTSTSPAPGASALAVATTRDGGVLASLRGHGVWQRRDEPGWERLGKEGALPADAMNLFVDSDGGVFAGTASGLWTHRAGTWQPFALGGAVPPEVNLLAGDGAGGIWIATDAGLWHDADARSGGATQVPVPSGAEVQAVSADREGAIWAGAGAHLARYVGSLWQRPDDPLVAGRPTTALLVDRLGRTWAGIKDAGLSVFDGQHWQPVGKAQGLPDPRIVALFEDRAGRIWVSMQGRLGLLGPDGQWKFFSVSTSGLPSMPVRAFSEDGDGDIWLGSDGGLARWDELSGFRTVSALAGQRVQAIARSADGVFWAAGPARLWRDSGAGWQVVAPDDTAPHGAIPGGLRTLDNGETWAATPGDGLWVYRDGVWKRGEAPLPSPALNVLGGDGRTLIAGTAHGYARYDGLTWGAFRPGGLPAPGVYAAAPAEQGDWLGTTAGPTLHRLGKAGPTLVVETEDGVVAKGEPLSLPSDTLASLRHVAADVETPSDELAVYAQIEGVDPEPRRLAGNLADAYGPGVLAPGTHTLRMWARDADFNYSDPVEVPLEVPFMLNLPDGGRAPALDYAPGAVAALIGSFLLVWIGGRGLAGAIRRRHGAAADRARRQAALDRRYNPYVAGGPVRSPEMFFARDDALARIINGLHQNSFLVHGEPRVGKTSLLLQLGDRLRRPEDGEYEFIPVSVDLAGRSEDEFFAALMSSMWEVLRPAVEARRPLLRYQGMTGAYNDRDFVADAHELLSHLETMVAPRRPRLVLMLDELDTLNGYDPGVQQQFRRILSSDLSAQLGVVGAAIGVDKDWERAGSPWYNLFVGVPLAPFDATQARNLLEEPVRGVYDWSPEALDAVVVRAAGSPFLLQRYGFEAVNRMIAEGRTSIAICDVEAVDATFGAWPQASGAETPGA